MGKSRGGGSQTVTQTNETRLSPQQQQLLAGAMPRLLQAANMNIGAYPGGTVAGFTPDQQRARALARGSAEAMIPGINVANQALEFGLGPVLFPETNPALQGAINASIRPLTQTFQQSIMPSIGDSSRASGQPGSSRQGVAEGIASQALLNQVGDTSAQMANQGYQAGLDTFSRALALAPQTLSLFSQPATIYDAIGSQGQALEQALIDADVQRYFQDRLLPFEIAQQVASTAFGFPGTGVSSATGPSGISQPSAISRGLGGAAAGASLASVLKMSTPWGAGIGAVLGLLG